MDYIFFSLQFQANFLVGEKNLPGLRFLAGSGSGFNEYGSETLMTRDVDGDTYVCRTLCEAVTWACSPPTTSPGDTHPQSAPSWVRRSLNSSHCRSEQVKWPAEHRYR